MSERTLKKSQVMAEKVTLLDVVALLDDVPAVGLCKGQVGTVVELLDDETVLVDFSGEDGISYAIEPIAIERLLVLQYEPVVA